MHHCCVHGYHWLPIATIRFHRGVSLIIGNLKFEAYFEVVIPIGYRWGLIFSEVLEGASLFVLGYHWLPLATIDLVGDNREFEV